MPFLSRFSADAWRRHRRFLIFHALLWPLALVLLATWLRASGWDDRLSALWFDTATQRFPARDWPALEQYGHRLAKSVLLVGWFGLLAAAIAAPWVAPLRRHRRLLWVTVAAMGLGPLVVAGLKDINTHACPWDLKIFGGTAEYTARWFVSRSDAGRCFPGGHAAGGFSLVALGCAGYALGRRGIAWGGFAAALIVGSLFSGVRWVQGAHFMSHNLWSAAVDWWIAVAVFAPLLLRRADAASDTSSDTSSETSPGAADAHRRPPLP